MVDKKMDMTDLKDIRVPVLNDGFVRVVDVMGDDTSIVQAARISYGKGTKKTNEDRGLIRYLMRHRHTTPLEMCEIKLHVRVPMDCWRQWIRHRTASVNEYSTRYSEAIDATQSTSPTHWRSQSASNKQGSADFLPEETGMLLSSEEQSLHLQIRSVYESRIAQGVAREQARKDLSLSTYTEAYWKIDLHNLLHFLALRMDSHAQFEIRQYATVIGEQIVSKWVPLAWEAFCDYRLNAISLSAIELRLLRALNSRGVDEFLVQAREAGFVSGGDLDLKFNREYTEFQQKALAMGVTLPTARKS